MNVHIVSFTLCASISNLEALRYFFVFPQLDPLYGIWL